MDDAARSLIQKQFGAVAQNYASSRVHASGVDLDAMLRCVPLRGDELTLDAGCGSGHTAALFASQVGHATAFDLTQEMLLETRKLAELRDFDNVFAVQGNVIDLPFEANTFDIVVSRYSAHHWANPQRAIREFARVLKFQAGYVILSDVVAPADILIDSYLQAIELLRDPSHVRDHTAGQWIEMFQNAGFKARVVHEFEVELDFVSWLTRMSTPPLMSKTIRELLRGAPSRVKEIMQISLDGLSRDTFRFVFPGAIFLASI